MIPEYAVLKAIHVGCAAASYALFCLRGVWMMRNAAIRRARWVRIVPHVVDTVLLTSAIAMTVAIGQYPFGAGWLTAKVLALVLYIALGLVALKWGPDLRVRLVAWVAAQAVFLYIVAVALTRYPVPWLSPA
jgi:uncharacterized membrane protein SirB2